MMARSTLDRKTGLRGFMGRLAAILLGGVFLLQATAGVQAAAPARTAHLIYAGWFGSTIPTPAYVAEHKAFLESQPFDGLIVYLRNDATGLNATTSVMSANPLSAAGMTTLLAPMQGQVFTTLRENFGLVQGATPPDFFDDWTVTVQNFATVAKSLMDAGLKGIVFDNEQYSKPWGNYPLGVRYPNRTLAEYQVQARLRGNQVMAAMVAQFPSVEVMTLHGPYISEPQAPASLFPSWWTQNQLLGPFFSGCMEGSGSTSINIDGGELYNLRSPADFLSSYNWRKFTLPSDAVNCSFIPPALRPSWPGRSSISFGVYDYPFGGAAMNPTILRPTVTNALLQADKYVWLYIEGPSFLLPSSQGGADIATVDAVRQGRIDAGTSATPSSGPAAPSHFAASVVSASEVDLSWWDMSADETGFEVERKTGATGTWSRVLTTTANVSAINDIGLTAGTSYVYRLRSVNVSGASAYSSEVGAATPGAPAVPQGPAAPSHFAAATLSASAVTLSWWDMSSDETGFEVERKTGSAGTWSRVLTTNANVSAINDTGLAAGTSYVYRVRSVNASGPSAYSAEAGAATSAGAPGPAAPTNLSIRTLAVSMIGITWWDMSSNETGFQVERKTGSKGSWSRIATPAANVSTLDDRTVVRGTRYYYRARAVNLAGTSAYSNEITAVGP